MKEKIKNLLLIIWILISLKIISLTFGNVTVILIGSFWSFFNFLHLPFNFINDLVIYTASWKPIQNDFTVLPILRGYTDILLFVFVISSWGIYFLYKKNLNIKELNYINYIILISLVSFYIFELCRDMILDLFVNNILFGLENTFYFKILQVIITGTILLNILNTVYIFLGTNWKIYNKIILSIVILGISSLSCGLIDVFIIYEKGTLFHLLNTPSVNETRTIEELMSALISSYNIDFISWCNPSTEPCEYYRKRIESLCYIPDIVQSFPIGGTSMSSQLFGGISPHIVQHASSCLELKAQLKACMDLHMQQEFARQWLEAHPPITAKPYVGVKVIDTWSWAIKKR